MAEHYAIRTGVDRDWEGRERAFVALDVRYGDNYFYQERERWWFDLMIGSSVCCRPQFRGFVIAAKPLFVDELW